MNNRDLRLEEALSDIRREHLHTTPPEAVKATFIRNVKEGLRPQRFSRLFWPRPILLGPFILLLCAIGVAGFILTRHTAAPPETPIATQKPLQPEIHSAQEASVSHPTQSHAHEQSAKAIRPIKGASGFIALPSSEGLPTPNVATVVRMRIKPGDLRAFGLHVSPVASQQTILAEFVVGEDGLSRAVRLIR